LSDTKYYHCPICGSLTANPIIGDLMAKKSEETPVKDTVWESKAVVCQCCFFHDNKPSTCRLRKLPVGRKEKGCEFFDRRK